jgi:PAS domain S-box-containing protein
LKSWRSALARLLGPRASAVRLSEERYALAMAAAGDGHTDWNLVTGESYISPRMLEILGFAPDTVFADRADWVRCFPFHSEDRPRWEAAVADHFAGREAKFRMDLRIVVRGETRWAAFTFVCGRDAGGKPVRWTGSIADITERKRAEEALQHSRRGYDLAMDAAQDGYWDWDMVTGAYYMSPRNYEIYGFPAGTKFASRDEFIASPYLPGGSDEWVRATKELYAGTGTRLSMESRVIVRGEARWFHRNGICVRDASGRPIRWTVSVRDVTDRKRAEEALRLSEQRSALALEATEEGHFDLNLDTEELFVSERLNEIQGLAPGTHVLKRSEYFRNIRFYAKDDEATYFSAVGAAETKDGPELYEFEFRILRPSGEMRWLRTRGKVTRDTEGRARRRTGVVADVTEQKRSEEALRRSEQGYELAMEAAQDAHWDWDMVTGEYYLSPRIHQIYAVPLGTKVATRADVLNLLPYSAEENDRWTRATAELFAGTGDRLSMEQPVVVRGETRWVQRNGVCVRDAGGKPIRWSGSARDVTDRRRAEEALRLSEERYRLALDASGEGHFDIDVATDSLYSSDRMLYEIFGYPPGARFRTRADFMKQFPFYGDDGELYRSEVDRAMVKGGPDHYEFEFRIARPSGEVRWLWTRAKITRDADGNPLRRAGVCRDITGAKLATDELRASEARFRTLVQLNSSGFWEQDENLRYVPSGFALDISGYATDGRVGKTRWELSGDPTPLSGSWAEHQADLAARLPFRDFEYRRVGPDGQTGYYSASGAPIFDDLGRFKGYYGVASDITQRKRIEEELRRAQRLEAMGTLAGGIAHDFNNILGAILGYGEMATRNSKPGTRLRRDLDSIMAAGERGRALIDRILAFSRSGVSERIPVHVQGVVREVLGQVTASLPRNVSVTQRLRAGRAAMLGDSTQVHQVVMNLASNAVQAMPQGGVLRVALETAYVDLARSATIGALAPGDYIMLRLSDSGSGMADDVLEQMFDPFFTTKEVGVGSGLGLSLVHGIVTSVDGAIDVVTELGKGTTFTVYLRRSGDAPRKAADENRPLPRGDGQRVLVVDDEELLVRLATETLKSLGYVPIGFTSSVAALAAFRADPMRFDALLTDERMPGLTGSALIREAREIRDAMPVVLMSGYLGMESVDADVVVRKPLSARDLAACMERALRPSKL